MTSLKIPDPTLCNQIQTKYCNQEQEQEQHKIQIVIRNNSRNMYREILGASKSTTPPRATTSQSKSTPSPFGSNYDPIFLSIHWFLTNPNFIYKNT
jgi:hypothetical protein